jgi:hypothetical protein
MQPQIQSRLLTRMQALKSKVYVGLHFFGGGGFMAIGFVMAVYIWLQVQKVCNGFRFDSAHCRRAVSGYSGLPQPGCPPEVPQVLHAPAWRPGMSGGRLADEAAAGW